jgi:flagellar hook-length control protein FliK
MGGSATGTGPLLSTTGETLPLAPLPAEPLGPGRTPGLAPLAQGMAAPTLATPPDAAMAAALARQPAALLIPNLDEDTRGLMAVGETASPDRSDSLTTLGLGSLSTSSASASRLDLSQAFPAPVPMPSPKFAEDLGARLQWMAGQQGGDATLRIAPDGLGPVEIRLRLDGDRVELGFLAAQQDTRQALQDALPKLREMLAQQGLQLGHADVGQRQSGASGGSDGERRQASEDEGDGGTRGVASATLPAPRVVIGSGRGMLDLYA